MTDPDLTTARAAIFNAAEAMAKVYDQRANRAFAGFGYHYNAEQAKLIRESLTLLRGPASAPTDEDTMDGETTWPAAGDASL